MGLWITVWIWMMTASAQDTVESTPLLKCDRQVLYRSKPIPCDSVLDRDGEGLRPYFEGNEQALDALNRYQRNRKRLRYSAYAGTAGLLTILLSPTIGRLLSPSNRDSTEKIVRLTGFGIMFGGFAFTFSALKANELLLNKAIQQHNLKSPDRPMELTYRMEF